MLPEAGKVYRYTGPSIEDFPTKMLALASWSDSYGTARSIFLFLDGDRPGEVQKWELDLPRWNLCWNRISCTSDDPCNHQGDTCPIHED